MTRDTRRDQSLAESVRGPWYDWPRNTQLADLLVAYRHVMLGVQQQSERGELAWQEAKSEAARLSNATASGPTPP